MSGTESDKQKTVFILYIPGGGVLGLLPAMLLAKLESLTETPTEELFQVLEGVSTGSIIVGAMAKEGVDAKMGTELFVQQSPRFFPDIPGRLGKMSFRNGINLGKYLFRLDPSKMDSLKIKEIHKLCDKMEARADKESLPAIRELRQLSTERWLTAPNKKRCLAVCEEIQKNEPNLGKHAEAIAEMVGLRSYTSRLGHVFKRNTVCVMNRLKDYFAVRSECLYDPKVPEEYYKSLLGDMQISNCKRSTYISAYDMVRNRVVTFSKLNKDLFSMDADGDAKVDNDIKIWDAIMASTANPFAFPPHITETNILCSDKAVIHKPRSVRDVVANVDDDTRVVLVIAGTGKYLSSDLAQFIDHDLREENENLTESELYRKILEKKRDEYAELGVFGNLIMGRETSELEAYTTSEAMEDFGELLGKENIIEISARMAPHTPREESEFPSKNILDASRENMKKIIRRGRENLRNEDDRIRDLAQQLVDNLHLLGQMDDEKYERVCKKIGLKLPDIEMERRAERMEKNVPDNDQSTGLRRAWRRMRRALFESSDITRPPPPDKPPKP